jgi:predicted RNase H-like nuclease (RuvC/YqgF family)
LEQLIRRDQQARDSAPGRQHDESSSTPDGSSPFAVPISDRIHEIRSRDLVSLVDAKLRFLEERNATLETMLSAASVNHRQLAHELEEAQARCAGAITFERRALTLQEEVNRLRGDLQHALMRQEQQADDFHRAHLAQLEDHRTQIESRDKEIAALREAVKHLASIKP